MDPMGEATDFNSFPEYAPMQNKQYTLGHEDIAYIATLIINDWRKTKRQVGSWFDDPANFVEYCAWWLENCGRYVPGLGAGIDLGTGMTGTSVTGESLDRQESLNRSVRGIIEMALIIYQAYAPEPMKNPLPERSKTESFGFDEVPNKQYLNQIDDFVDIYKSPNPRHYLTRVKQNSTAKAINTVIEPSVDVAGDVVAINRGLAEKIGDKFIINNRIYAVKPNGTLVH